MRVTIEVREDDADGWDVHIRFATPDGEVERRRAMGRTAYEPSVAPVAPAVADVPQAALRGPAGAERLKQIVARLRRRTPDAEQRDLELIGRHLFDSLIGDETWSEITAVADGGMVELALRWPSTAALLHGVPWELMHDGGSFLSVHRGLPVAIVRVIGDTRQGPPSQIAAPARVLFVLGEDLDEPTIRPGTEVMGLLRESRGSPRRIRPLILDRASERTIRETVARWRPDIVHVISHGQLNARREGEVRLRPNDPDAPKGKYEWVGAAGLADALTMGGALPTIVIVTGCDSGAGGPHTSPLAVELVRRDVPVVVAMTGEVSDTACRMFTRHLALVIAEGRPLVEAVAHARRAAYSDGPPLARADWSMPAVYLREDVPPGFAPVDTAGADRLTKRLVALDLLEDPVFCGRRDFFRRFEELVGPGSERRTLVVCACSHKPGLGRRRLLMELAAHALLTGHVPLILDRTSSPPHTVAAMGVELVRALVATSRAFGLPSPADSQLLALLAEQAGVPLDLADHEDPQRRFHLRDRLNAIASSSTLRLDPSNLADAFRGDAATLLRTAREQGDPTLGEHTRAVLFLHGIERGEVRTELLRQTLHDLSTGDGGVPVIASWDDPTKAKSELALAREELAGRRWISFEDLGPFAENGEDTLAYQWVLMHPWRADHRYARSVWVARYDIERGDREPDWWPYFREFMEGMPSNFTNNTIHILASGFFDSHDDERVLKEYLSAQLTAQHV